MRDPSGMEKRLAFVPLQGQPGGAKGAVSSANLGATGRFNGRSRWVCGHHTRLRHDDAEAAAATTTGFSRSQQKSTSRRCAVAGACVPPRMAIDAVQIQRPNRDTRVVKSGIRIAAPIECVWGVLTNYNELADVVPNLAVSRLVSAPNGAIRLEQCGVQKILGFEFQAAVTMDMTERGKDNENLRSILFSLSTSRDFKKFEGEWCLSKINERYTKLNYEVLISPKGFVPVAAVEWRIKEDIPANLIAVKKACEAMVAAGARK